MIYRREQGEPTAAGITPDLYRKQGLVRRTRLDKDAVQALMDHLRQDHGHTEPFGDVFGAAVSRLSPDEAGAYPFDTHKTTPDAAAFLRLHAQAHQRMGTPLE